MNNEENNKIISVPQQVVGQFLEELKKQNVPEEVVNRLRKTIIEDGKFSVEALKVALFSNDIFKI